MTDISCCYPYQFGQRNHALYCAKYGLPGPDFMLSPDNKLTVEYNGVTLHCPPWIIGVISDRAQRRMEPKIKYVPIESEVSGWAIFIIVFLLFSNTLLTIAVLT